MYSLNSFSGDGHYRLTSSKSGEDYSTPSPPWRYQWCYRWQISYIFTLLEARGYRSPPIAKLLVVNTHEVPFSATFGFVKSKIGLYTPRQLMEALRLDEIAGVTGDNVPGFHGQS